MTQHFMSHAAELARKAASNGDSETKQFTLDEQIERARRAAARMDAGYYFTDAELDDESLKAAPHRPTNDKDEWL